MTVINEETGRLGDSIGQNYATIVKQQGARYVIHFSLKFISGSVAMQTPRDGRAQDNLPQGLARSESR